MTTKTKIEGTNTQICEILSIKFYKNESLVIGKLNSTNEIFIVDESEVERNLKVGDIVRGSFSRCSHHSGILFIAEEILAA